MNEARPPSLLCLPSYVATQLGRIGRAMLAEALARQGLRPPHFALLVALSDFGTLPQHELADRLGFNRSHTVGYLDTLQGRGLIRRDRDDGDRRRRLVALTAPGRELHQELAGVAQASQDRFLQVLDEPERQTLLELMRRVLDANITDHPPVDLE